MSCPGSEQLLAWLDEAPRGADRAHLAACGACAAALDDMARVRRLARALGPPRAAAAPPPARRPRRRAHPLQPLLTTAAALALFAALGAQPALRSRIERGPRGATPVAFVGSQAHPFWTSGLAQVGGH